MSNSAQLSLLPQLFFPSRPISDHELLRGREEQLREVESAFRSPGRHVFIYGDRGVGKTSLAQTAALRVTDRPILLTCERSTTLESLVNDVLNRVDPGGLEASGESVQTSGKAGIYGTGVERGRSQDFRPRPRSGSMNDLVGTLKEICSEHREPPVVIIDEFNLLTNQEEQERVGDFIKQCSDQYVNIRLMFVGIGRSLTDLLHGHGSAYRYLSQISLPRLGWDARMEILHHAERNLGIHLDKHYAFRIAGISDGFPHYIHLIGEKVFEQVLESPKGDTVDASQYDKAIELSVKGVEHYLSEIYAKATEKYDDVYQEILWAVADAPVLRRPSAEIFESYERIAKARGKTPLPRDKFNTRLNRLKSEPHGKILEGSRQGWYEFTEPMVRGYVRLCAERAGVDLDIEHGLSSGKGV